MPVHAADEVGAQNVWRGPGQLAEQVYLDLSGMGAGCLQEIDACPKLHTLIARNNNMLHLRDLSCCPELWRLDVINNQVRGSPHHHRVDEL